MTRSRVDGLCLLALGAAMFVTLGIAAEHLMGRGSLEDFKALLGWELGHLVWMTLIVACLSSQPIWLGLLERTMRH